MNDSLTKSTSPRATDSELFSAAVLVVDKPTGISSFDVLRRLKPCLPRGVRVGHAGTLDPAASGVLVVCTGAATRLVSHFQDMQKTYVARVRFGTTTDSDDLDGEVIATAPVPQGLLGKSLPDLLQPFIGPIMQRPPDYSAVKLAGVRAYSLARQGAPVVIRPREVTVHAISIQEISGVEATLLIQCSSGTYIRSIARDLGVAAGCGACLSALRRTAIGGFGLENALPVDGLNPESVRARAMPLLASFASADRIAVDAEEAVRVGSGLIPHALAARLAVHEGGSLVALENGAGRLLAVIRKTGDDWRFVLVVPAAPEVA